MQISTPAIGGVVVIRGERWRVERVARCGEVTRVDVAAAALGRRLTFLAPFDDIARGDRRRLRHARSRHAMARLARLVAGIDRLHVPLAALHARIDLMPHQIEPALALLAGCRRVLVADDVGLGKTIQAGLAVAEIVRRHAAARILIVVPSSLRAQWVEELRVRFALAAQSLDAGAIERSAGMLARASNPWLEPGISVVSLDYLKQRHVIDALPVVLWDLVVIDEAHIACGQSERHAAARALTERARQVLLLTATPNSGDERAAVALLNLGAVAGLSDRLVVFRRTRRDLHWPSTRRVRRLRVRPSAAEARLLDALAAFDAAAMDASGMAHHAGTLLLLSVLRKRALSTPTALAISAARRLAWLRDSTHNVDEWQPALDFGDHEDVLSADEMAGLTAETGLSRDVESHWFVRLGALADQASADDTKLRRLATLIRRAAEPVVVFTEFRDSLARCRMRLASAAAGMEVVELHGGLGASEVARALAAFGRTAPILLATDVASQGLNLQHRARWVINLDLPWNPARLEQRAGRVDRLGQSRAPHITLLSIDHALDDDLLRRLHARVDRAQQAFDGDALLGETLPAESVARVAGPFPKRREDLPLDEARDRPFCVTTRWQRAAHLVVRDLARRRALIGPHEDTRSAGRPIRARRRYSRTGADHPWLVFSVPFVGGDGSTIERHVVVLESTGGTVTHETIALAGDLARRSLARCCGQAGARARVRRHRRVIVSQALTDACCLQLAPAECQPGLPAMRDARAAYRQMEVASLVAEIRAQLDHERQGRVERSTVTVGAARLEVVLD